MKKVKVFRYFNKESVFGWKSHFYKIINEKKVETNVVRHIVTKAGR